ncbi:MAG: HPr kinase/phosphatase C-terminal domain-containing protein [Rhodobacteraceae bacterium]|nr:HPr kinase/phosphatase C-terminal domain-containing protein [Paracoccaceae bacterium]
MNGAAADGTVLLHASAVAIDGRGLLITGAAGKGKSTLALALIGFGAVLVSDDLTQVTRMGNHLSLSCPNPELKGVIEARGVGLIRTVVQDAAPLALVVDLDQSETARLPPQRNVSLLGCAIDLVYGSKSPTFPVALMLQLRHGRHA